MPPQAITPKLVHDTLKAIRSSKRLRDSPLLNLMALQRRLDAEGMADTRDGRVGLLPRWLEEITWSRLARLRGQGQATRSATQSPDQWLAQLTADFQAHNIEREAWGLLHFRFFSGSNLTLLQLADRIGVADKTLRRRIERAYQALADELQDREQAAVSGTSRGYSIPEELTSFVGREGELAAVRRLLAEHRLVTLTAPGGMGKSRLAVRLARELAPDFADGAWFVDLSVLTEGRQVPTAITRVFGLPEQRGRTPTDTVLDHLADKRLLLILDNCEQVVSTVSQLVRDILSRCARVQVLTTSREELHAGGQAVFTVPPMSLPPESEQVPVGSVQHFDSVRLFTRRAAADWPGFSVVDGNAAQVARLCRQLDGIPLAIELAAARARVLTLDQIEQRLTDRFRLLRDGRHATRPGHETMRAALDGSFELLSRPERDLFMRLSVFQGGWTIEAAEAVCVGGSVVHGEVLGFMTELAAKSLIVAQHGSEQVRYCFLETLRQYAGERLAESVDPATWHDRHLSYFLTLAETAAPALSGPEQVQWLRRLEQEESNFYVALAYARTPVAIGRGLRLGNALAPFWHARGRQEEGGLELAALMAIEGAGATGAPYAEALTNAGRFAVTRFEPDVAEPLLLEALACWRGLGDLSGEGRALRHLGSCAERRGDLEDAEAYLQRSMSLLSEAGETGEMAYAMLLFATVCGWRGDADLRRRLLEEVTAIARTMGNWLMLANVLGNRGIQALEDGEFDFAADLFRESQELTKALGDRRSMAINLVNWGTLELLRGDIDAGCRLLEESLGYWRDIGDRSGVSLTLGCLGEAFLLAGALDAAIARLEASLAVERDLSDTRLQDALDLWIRLELARDRPEHALWILGAVAQSREENGTPAAPQNAAAVNDAEHAARAALGDARAAQAIAAGRQLTLRETAACVLGEQPWRFETTHRPVSSS